MNGAHPSLLPSFAASERDVPQFSAFISFGYLSSIWTDNPPAEPFESLAEPICAGFRHYFQSSENHQALPKTIATFPGEATACTRFATEIRLRRVEKESFTISIIPDKMNRSYQEQECLRQFGITIDKWMSYMTFMRLAVEQLRR